MVHCDWLRMVLLIRQPEPSLAGAAAISAQLPSFSSSFFCSRSSRQIKQRPQSLLFVRIRTSSLFLCLLHALELVLPERGRCLKESFERLRSSPITCTRDPTQRQTIRHHALYFCLTVSSATLSSTYNSHRSLLCIRHSLPSTSTMFKRSFNTKDGRVTKMRPVKTTYREHAKKKMQESLDSPPVGR
jgi:hypothetical protein